MIRRDLIFIGVIIVLLTIVFYQSCSGPEPIEDTRKYDSLIRVSREGEAKAKELSQLRRRDSVSSVEGKKVYEDKILKLNRRLKSINTSKATDKQLDSLIMVLYGE